MDRNRKYILGLAVFVVLVIFYAISKTNSEKHISILSEAPSKIEGNLNRKNLEEEVASQEKNQASKEQQESARKLTDTEVNQSKGGDEGIIVSSSNEPSQDKKSKEETRKTLLDAVRRGVVIIKVKAYASADSGEGSAWSGTGFIVDLEKGLIATNHHVAGDMAICTYEIKFSDGTTTTAKLKFFDPLLDFAFLTIDPKDFPKSSMVLEISKRSIKVNDTIYSMGNSAGDEFSTYKGTVFSVYENLGPFPEQSFKFSGLTVGGASGSPVFGDDGKVVGIIYGGKFVSGAALPINYIVRSLNQLKKGEVPSRRSIGLIPRYDDLKDVVEAGVVPESAREDYNKEFPESHNKILVVDARLVDSPAQNLFQVGDVLWKVDGKLIGPELAKLDEILDTSGDKTIPIEVYREGKLVQLDVKTYPLLTQSAKKFISFAGATWFNHNEQVRYMVGDKGPGVYISFAGVTSPFKELYKSSWWGGNRLLKITHINNKPIRSLDDLQKLIPDLLGKKVFDVKYIDFLGQQSIGNTISADRQERWAMLKYDSKFDDPRIFEFDHITYEWDIKPLKDGASGKTLGF